MFSTLLGPLPAIAIADIEATGIELLATGAPPASGDEEPASVVAAWRAVGDASERAVKQVLAGPYSAGRDGPRDRPAELAERLRATILALTEAGCPFVEIDEPDALAITLVPGERARFVNAHRRLVDGLSGVHVSLALSGGNLDGAGPATFFDLAYASFAFDLIAGPDNWRLIAQAPGDRGIVCGALDPSAGGDETPELLMWAAHYAASTQGRGLDRVGLANAPGLATLEPDVALRKLRRVARAATLAGTDPQAAAASLDPRAFGGRRNRPGRIRPGDDPTP
jgi:methionine synthase II (cobalamin-independent)